MQHQNIIIEEKAIDSLNNKFPEKQALLTEAIKESNEIIKKINEIKSSLKRFEFTEKFFSANIQSNFFDINQYAKACLNDHNGILYPSMLDLRDSNLEEIREIHKEIQASILSISESLEKEEAKRKEVLNKIEDLLQEGANPNIPEILQLNEFLAESPKLVPIKIYPLHRALDNNALALLGKYGANPNVLGYGAIESNNTFSKEYAKAWDNLSPLMAACLEYAHSKAETLISLMPHTINSGMAEKCLEILIDHINEPYLSDYHPYGLSNKVETTTTRSAYLHMLSLIRKLSEKASARFLCELLEFELSHEKRALKKVNLSWHDLIRDKIEIYTTCLNQKLSFPLWMTLVAGHWQRGNALNILPQEILQLIIISLLYSNLYENALAEIDIKKLDAFKKTYLMLMENGFKNDFSFSNRLFDLNTKDNPKTLISYIKDKVSQESKKVYFSDDDNKSSIVKKAWQLTNKYYDNFSLEQEEFSKIINNKKKVSAFKILQTILSELDPQFQSYHLLDINEEVNSPQDFIALIKDKINSSKQDKITIHAWKLAQEHYDDLSDQNSILINELVKWAIENNTAYDVLSTTFYKLTLFEPIKNMHFSAIKDDLSKRLNELISVNEDKKRSFIAFK